MTTPWYRNSMRWSGDAHDHRWGPFNFSTSGYRPWSLTISSWGGGQDNDQPCHLRIGCPWFGTLMITLPTIIRPHIGKVYPDWDAETVARLGRNWYEDIDERTYGFSLSSSGTVGNKWPDFFQVYYGRAGGSCMDSSIEQRWSCFLPWLQWRHVRKSYHGCLGELIGHEEPGAKYFGNDPKLERNRKLEESCPTMQFTFKDFDGETLIATTKIEEMEWRAGTGWWKWLSWFRKPMIRRYLDIRYSDEVGKRKGSWKGGTIGCSIDMDRGPDGQFWELHLGAFMRHCMAENLTFVCIGKPAGWDDEATPKVDGAGK